MTRPPPPPPPIPNAVNAIQPPAQVAPPVPPPPPPQGQAIPAPPPVAVAAAPAEPPGLDNTLETVCQVRVGCQPMDCYSQSRGRWNVGGLRLLTDVAPNLNVISEAMRKRLLTALSAVRMGSQQAYEFSRSITIREFRERNQDQQIQFINDLWDRVTTSHEFNMLTSNMYDPAYDIPPDHQSPLPSSWCPHPRDANTYIKRLAGHRPWREMGVGFRIDGNHQNDIDRILRDGFTQQRLNLGFMRGTRGQEIEGTVLNNANRARVWTGNHDIFNETAVCVSRNFFGATAFPERTTNHALGQFCYLWAANCMFLRGFDTEGYQVGLGHARQWRPGEKAFREIAKDRVIAYVPIRRLGAPDVGGWRFEIAADATWHYVNEPNQSQKNYMEEELAAWKGSHTIPAAFDFAN